MIYCVLCNSHGCAERCKNQQKGEAVIIQPPPPHVLLDITCSGYDHMTLKRSCSRPVLQGWQTILVLQHFILYLKLHHLLLPGGVESLFGYSEVLHKYMYWTCYCSAWTKNIFRNVSISRWNPWSPEIFHGKTPLGFKRGSVSPFPFYMH